jgi:hypothetical protein
MRIALLPFLLCGVLPSSAFATDIYQNFIILEASNLSPVGGTFSQGGTFFGTFSVDTSDIPGSGASVGLTNVAVTTTGVQGIPNENTYDSGTLTLLNAFFDQALLLGNYELAFTSSNGSQLDLETIEVLGTFAGGQIVQATETGTGTNRNDSSGDAVLIDPAFLAPEPGSIGMGGAGLAMLGAVAWIGRRRVWAGKPK